MSHIGPGYNHLSPESISSFLEPTAAGPSTLWAQRTAQSLKCTVAVGYPERDSSADPPRAYNSLVFVNFLGQVVGHTRKSFLYYTDETWASEGSGFFASDLPIGPPKQGNGHMRVAAGICMDINPYKFEAPWGTYEFATHVLTSTEKLVIVSADWLTRLSEEDLQTNAMSPDMDTFGYWLERLRPLFGPDGSPDEIIVVFANRCGEEGISPIMGAVRYAGSSTVLGMTRAHATENGDVRIWDILGRNQEGFLVVDTNAVPRYGLVRKERAQEANGQV